ncbi:MAG: YgfZ/GcvT domain-containing protein [Actinomycetota bacterium]
MELRFADRSERGKLRLVGPQRLWFLHQIMTQAFEDMKPGQDRDTALITARGRMVGYMETVATEDSVLAHFEPELRADLPDAVRRYIFATQVEVDDVSDQMALLLVVGKGWSEVASRVAPEGVLHPTRSLGTDAAYLWAPFAARDQIIAGLRDAAEPATEDELEAIRIRNGAPRWGREMTPKSLPQEAGIDAWAVHFDKGCYVGQEAMAKIHFRGKVNKRLVRLEAEGVGAGESVVQDGATVGTVTSAADEVALAIVKHTVEPSSEVEVEGVKARVMG